MSLVEIDWSPKSKQLRSFGKIALLASTVIAFLLYLLKGIAIKWVLILFSFGLIIFIISMVSLRLTKIIYLGMVLFTLPIGYVVSFILLAAFYFLLLAPLGFIFRLIGRDPLNRRFEPDAKSYWLGKQPPKDPGQYFHQF